MKEFKINEYITVKLLTKIINEKLKYKEPVIYVDEKPFGCNGMYLILQSKRKSIDLEDKFLSKLGFDKFDLVENVEKIDELDPGYEYSGHAPKGVNSVDNIYAHLVGTLDEHEFEALYDGAISAEEKFWGYCSNLQVWAENDYDTNLLYTEISIPLLKSLKDAGDPIAKRVYKKEITKQFEQRNLNTMKFCITEGFTIVFDKEELINLLKVYISSIQPSKSSNLLNERKSMQIFALHSLFIDLTHSWSKKSEESERVAKVVKNILQIEYDFETF